MARKSHGLSRRQKTWIWIIVTTVIVVSLLYWEQIALLYVIATLSMTLLLVIVALSDLSGSKTVAALPTPADEPLPVESADIYATSSSKSKFATRHSKRRR